MIDKALVYEVIDSLMTEDYPSSFNMDDFKKLSSFNQRIKYCQENLKRISSGSSRIVYLIDNTKVLKLAKNKKGIAQCGVEISYGNDNYIGDILAKIFDYHPDGLWVEMELARKVKKEDFKRIIGFSFKDFCVALNNYSLTAGKNKYSHELPLDKNIYEAMWEDEFCYDIFNYIGNYDIQFQDLLRLNSYGIVNRNGEEKIVIIDYGLTNKVYSNYYDV